jgi:hypothetical protein
VSVHSGFIGKIPEWNSEAYILAGTVLIEDAPVHPLLLALIVTSPLFWLACILSILF